MIQGASHFPQAASSLRSQSLNMNVSRGVCRVVNRMRTRSEHQNTCVEKHTSEKKSSVTFTVRALHAVLVHTSANHSLKTSACSLKICQAQQICNLIANRASQGTTTAWKQQNRQRLTILLQRGSIVCYLIKRRRSRAA